MAFTREQVAEIYVATFNRAPDSYGLNYWVNDSGCNDIDEVASSFFDSEEAHVLYPIGTSTQAQVAAAYQNLFNRAPDDDGLNYWIGEIDEGRISQSLMLQALINGAQGDDITIMANKTQVGLTFADAGHDDVESARSVMSEVTSDHTTVVTAQTTIAAMPAPAPGFVFTPEWLNGRTFYIVDDSNDDSNDNIYDSNDDSNDNIYDSNDDSIVKFVFNNGEVIESEFSVDGRVTSTERGIYSIDENGVLILNFNNEIEYMKGVEQISGLNAIVVTVDESYEYSYSHSEHNEYEYIFLDLASAELFIA